MDDNMKVAHGSMSKNKDRVSDRHPSHKGSLTLSKDVKAGEKVWIAAWEKIGDDGGKYFSLNVERSRPKIRSAPAVKVAAEDDDEIPF